jgi:hypothetical protein
VASVASTDPVTSGERSTPKFGSGEPGGGQSWVVRDDDVVVQLPPALGPRSHLLFTQMGQGWIPGAGPFRSPVTYTVTVSGSMISDSPVAPSIMPPTGGVLATRLITQVLTAAAPGFGIGSGGPKKQPGALHWVMLPVSVDDAGPRMRAVGSLQSVTL